MRRVRAPGADAVTPLLVAVSLGVRVAGRDILGGVDLAVGPTEVVAVLGPSGAGKTTLLGCLGGLQRPTSGSVTVLGQELSSMRAGARARFRLHEIGFVYQHADLLPELTPVQNVMLPALLAGIDPQQAQQDAEALIDELGVRTSAETSNVSGGEAQRLALARALMVGPSLLLADEPTGSLDEDTRDEVLEMMLTVVRERGMGAVVVTHDRAVAARADRTITLQLTAVG